MASIYRISRNTEASIIQYIREELSSAGWNDIVVEKTFARIYGIPVDTFKKQGAICLRLSDTAHDQAEIGETSTRRFPLILIDIFAVNDGQRLDLKDFLVSVLRRGMPFFEYEITNGAITSKIQDGRIRVTNIDDTAVNFAVDKSALDIHDRYRHLLTLNIAFGRIEA